MYSNTYSMPNYNNNMYSTNPSQDRIFPGGFILPFAAGIATAPLFYGPNYYRPRPYPMPYPPRPFPPRPYPPRPYF